jgi:site-specific DNA recombinase
MTSRPVRAIVGARVSSFQDGKESQITQRSKGTAYAESQGWDVVGAFEDLDVSAIKYSPWDRPDLKVYLTEKADEWDALIFAKTDRVFRNAADCVRLAEWCRDNRKILCLVDDGIRLDYFHPEDSKDAFAGAMSKVFLILASVFAEIEGQRFVQRALDRVTQYRHQPRWAYGVPPYGFEVVDRPEGGKMLGHDVEAQEVLQGIAGRLLAGDSLTRVTSDLNSGSFSDPRCKGRKHVEGCDCRPPDVLSPADRLRQRTGKPLKCSAWTIITVQTVLSNPATQGVKTAKGKPVLDGSGEPVLVGPPSFDGETWTRIQSELGQRSQSGKQRQHSLNPLLGVAKCGLCGKNMRHFIQNKNGKTRRYYVCGASPKACLGVLIPADHAEEIVEGSFLHVHRDRRVRKQVWRDGSDHSQELEQTVRTIEALREDRALGLYSTPEDEALFRQQMTALVGKRDELSAQPVVKAGWVDVDTDRTYGEVWPAATTEERRKLLQDAGVRLTVRRRFDSPYTDVYTDLDRVLGEGARGEELWQELEQAAAEEQRQAGSGSSVAKGKVRG